MSTARTRASGSSRRTIGVAAACALALAVLPLPAQQPKPATPPPASASQQPGAGAQVHTGIVNDIDADGRIQNLLADHQFFLVESQLPQLPPQQAQLYRGILANRNNDSQASIRMLEPLLDSVVASGNKGQEKLLRKALAEDYLRTGDLARAASAYQTLDARLKDKLTPDERDEIELPLKLLPLAAANPPMTVDPADPFILPVSTDPLGLTDVPVYVDARPHSWMLDPTAPFNLISRSQAKQAGLQVSEASATIHTLTGKPIQVHVTVIPRFTIGGRITFHNMTTFVYNDADYFFPQSRYQVQGVLGYPALSALGRLTITADALIEVRPVKQIQPAPKDDRLTRGGRFFLDGDQIIVAMGKPGTRCDESTSHACKPGEERMFVVDAGSQQTYLTSRYYDEHTADFAGQKMELFTIPGSQTFPPQPAYTAENVSLSVGPVPVEFHYLQVITQPLGSVALDDVYGILGVDALNQLRAYTFDYRTMLFGIRPE